VLENYPVLDLSRIIELYFSLDRGIIGCPPLSIDLFVYDLDPDG
jgi:hypothetical protein